MSKMGRREVLRNSLGLSSALLGGISYEDKALLAQLVDRSEYGKVKEPVKGLHGGSLASTKSPGLSLGAI